MRIEEKQLLQILRIGHDTSMRGQGLSLRDALARSGYTLSLVKTPSAGVRLVGSAVDLFLCRVEHDLGGPGSNLKHVEHSQNRTRDEAKQATAACGPRCSPR